ncbi:matrixin family metalloprotease [Nocardioides sp. zg-579]|uniref:Matrixin family metalloprotease n=1 Tax=Nocardioides marmotae TaxID=2663857 RepID=A0A6I3J242_9ACTN|nr:matrixin family metalloprotease [Nocardioides marmotae]MCR6030830.1 matrixin family metalloprotease [Gordonia jinghuaiqii]MTB94466.1 matrixin family metalloprotease [Nocardioides marmotae]QKE01513.1 matrixin family metalloprotease [Nocardioides marmotae]
MTPLRTLTALLLAVLLGALLQPSAATGSDGRPIEVAWPGPVPVGTPARVSVTLAADSFDRQAELLRKEQDSWVALRARTVAAGNGRITFTLPTSYQHRARYRVRVAPGAVQPELAQTDRVEVVLPYEPRGNPKAHRRIYQGSFDPPDVYMRWDPCRPVAYAVNDRLATRGAVRDVKRAFRRLHVASGIRFRYLGRTRDRVAAKPVTFSSGADIVVGWVKDGTSMLSGSYTGSWGRAVPHYDADWQDSRGRRVARIYQASIAISDEEDLYLHPGARRFPNRTHLLMHELGHAVGLGHVNAENQVMLSSIPDSTANARYQAGDLAGMHTVGALQGCLTPGPDGLDPRPANPR